MGYLWPSFGGKKEPRDDMLIRTLGLGLILFVAVTLLADAWTGWSWLAAVVGIFLIGMSFFKKKARVYGDKTSEVSVHSIQKQQDVTSTLRSDLMSNQNITDLINQLTRLYDERADLMAQRRSIVDRQGRPIPNRERAEQELRGKIGNVNAQIQAVLAEWLANEQKMRVENPPFPPGATVETRFDVVVDAFMIGGKKQPKRASVPTGQVYVLSHGFETLDQSGFPEVYMAGEIIQKNPNRDDVQAWATVLAEFPGSLRLAARQVLAGISISGEDVAKANFVVPIRLFDPIQTLRRSGTQWMSPIGRKGINLALKEQIEHRIVEFFLDRLQLWSAEKQEVLANIYAAFTQDLQEWGLTVDTERISLIREYPRNIYEIVLEFASAEQAILDGMAADQDSLIQKTGLSPENLTS
ncbi:MAG: hypothetical protein V1897_18345, partial [Pseudomonadota bacterium]